MEKTIKSYTKTYENIRKTTTIDLTKQQALDANPKAIQQINCTGNLDVIIIDYCISLLKKSKKSF